MATIFYYFPLGTLPGLVVSCMLSLIYGTLVALRLAYSLVTQGKDKVLALKQRSKPSILNTDRWGKHRMIQLKNIKLHCVISGNPKNQIMLFIHGFPENWFSWNYQIEEFSQDYYTVAINMRGYGESDKPSGIAEYNIDQLVDDVCELLVTLNEERGRQGDKCVLVSHDWGGVVGWNVAHLHPELVDQNIVLNAPHSIAFRSRIAKDWKQFFASWYMFFFQLPYLPELLIQSNDLAIFDQALGKYFKSPEEAEVYKYYFSNGPNAVTGPLNYYRAMIRGYGKKAIRATAQQFRHKPLQPRTKIIWGRDDVALVEQLAQDSVPLCREASVSYVDKCSHWIQLQKPDQVNQIIRDFLATR